MTNTTSIQAIIEIAAESTPIKYEMNKDSGRLAVDRMVSSNLRYPCNYGYIPDTMGEDNDPLDILVLSPFPLLAGCEIMVRPLAMLAMEDESGIDQKILALPTAKICPQYASITELTDIGDIQLQQIIFFFEHYKLLEPGKWVRLQGWQSLEQAWDTIKAAQHRYGDDKA